MNCLELKTAIMKANKTYRSIARSLGISEQAFYNKVQGITEFKNSEIKKIASILHLSLAEVNFIFFDCEVN